MKNGRENTGNPAVDDTKVQGEEENNNHNDKKYRENELIVCAKHHDEKAGKLDSMREQKQNKGQRTCPHFHTDPSHKRRDSCQHLKSAKRGTKREKTKKEAYHPSQLLCAQRGSSIYLPMTIGVSCARRFRVSQRVSTRVQRALCRTAARSGFSRARRAKRFSLLRNS